MSFTTCAFQGSQRADKHLGRIVTGFGNGMNTSSIPVWQSEMAPPKIRGFLVLFEGALITGGIMLSYWVCLLRVLCIHATSADLISSHVGQLWFLVRHAIRFIPMAIPDSPPSSVWNRSHYRRPSIPRVSSMVDQEWTRRRGKRDHGSAGKQDT